MCPNTPFTYPLTKTEGFHIGQEVRPKHSKPQRGVSIPAALPDYPTPTVLLTHEHGANPGLIIVYILSFLHGCRTGTHLLLRFGSRGGTDQCKGGSAPHSEAAGSAVKAQQSTDICAAYSQTERSSLVWFHIEIH